MGKLLFFDIETVGISNYLSGLRGINPGLHKYWSKIADYSRRTIKGLEDKSDEDLFIERAALVPEYNKIVAVSMGFKMPDGSIKMMSKYGDDEKEILLGVKDVFDKCDKSGFELCGHNIKHFDIPTLGKKYLIHEIPVPTLLPRYDTKPWNMKAVDTKDIWNFGNNRGFSSLELVCIAMGIESPKDDIGGSEVHKTYWAGDGLERIKDYCEKDVKVLIHLMDKFNKVI